MGCNSYFFILEKQKEFHLGSNVLILLIARSAAQAGVISEVVNILNKTEVS